MRMLWLARMALEILWPVYAVLGAVVMAEAWRRGVKPQTLPVAASSRELSAVVLAPWLLVLWSGVMYGAEQYPWTGGFRWASTIHSVAALTIAGISFYAMVRWRRNWTVSVPCGLAALAATAINWFVGAMAIANDWI
ncbi:MAG: hypothetical protein IPJ78_17285 [Gemmatimonadetes bacterium]|nr:hypothetical protein [Gemmatimonadota bacterium]